MKIMLIFLALLFSFHSKNCEAGKILESERTYTSNQLTITEKTKIELTGNFKKSFPANLNEKIGPVYPSHSLVTHEKSIGGIRIFQSRYTIGDFGLRVSPSASGERHLIIAGDSNVFGEGCNDSETLFAFLGPETPGVHLYNFGHRGGGPHNTLALLEFFPALSGIKEPRGLFLYNFFPAHMIERVIGGKNYSGWDTGMSPWYSLNDKDELIYNGQFKKRSITRIYQWMAGSQLLNRLFPSLPRIGKSHLHLVAKVFERMKVLYLQKFPEGRFVVLLNQNSLIKDEFTDDLKSELLQLKIETIVMKGSDKNIKQSVFPDGHFNPNGQRFEAGRLREKLLEIFFLK